MLTDVRTCQLWYSWHRHSVASQCRRSNLTVLLSERQRADSTYALLTKRWRLSPPVSPGFARAITAWVSSELNHAYVVSDRDSTTCNTSFSYGPLRPAVHKHPGIWPVCNMGQTAARRFFASITTSYPLSGNGRSLQLHCCDGARHTARFM
jgi:hypothetical protein